MAKKGGVVQKKRELAVGKKGLAGQPRRKLTLPAKKFTSGQVIKL